MKSQLLLLQCVLNDLGTRCGVSTSRDMNYIRERVEHEGMEFLTLTLPVFGKDFEKSLDRGGVSTPRTSFGGYGEICPDRIVFRGYKTASNGSSGKLPAFLSGFTTQVFNAKTGAMLDDPCTDCIQAVRQITLMFSKIQQEVSPKKLEIAFRQYIECDASVRSYDFLDRSSNIRSSLVYRRWYSGKRSQLLTYGSMLVTFNRNTAPVQRLIEFLETESTISIIGPADLKGTFPWESIYFQAGPLI